MKLANIHAFGNVFDLTVTRVGDKLKIEAPGGSQLTIEGQPVTIKLPD